MATETSPEASPRRRNRWLTLSLRALILLVVLAAGAMGWLAYRIRSKRVAVAGIVKAGGILRYRWQSPNGRFEPKAAPPARNWYRDLLGPELFDEVDAVSLTGRNAIALLPQIAQFPSLKTLSLFDAAVSDADLAVIQGLTELRILHLVRVQGPGSVLRYLRGMRHMETIDAKGFSATDADLAHLEGLTSLRNLSLHAGGDRRRTRSSLPDDQPELPGPGRFKGDFGRARFLEGLPQALAPGTHECPNHFARTTRPARCDEDPPTRRQSH